MYKIVLFNESLSGSSDISIFALAEQVNKTDDKERNILHFVKNIL